jgi:hypothetical protein
LCMNFAFAANKSGLFGLYAPGTHRGAGALCKSAGATLHSRHQSYTALPREGRRVIVWPATRFERSGARTIPHASLLQGSTAMKNAGIGILLVCASGFLLTACASQAPVRQVAPAPAVDTAASRTSAPVAANRLGGTRRMVMDGVVYFCERPTPTGSRFIAPREQCYTEAQLRAIRERDQAFVHRQQALSLQTNTTAVMRTPVSP